MRPLESQPSRLNNRLCVCRTAAACSAVLGPTGMAHCHSGYGSPIGTFVIVTTRAVYVVRHRRPVFVPSTCFVLNELPEGRR